MEEFRLKKYDNIRTYFKILLTLWLFIFIILIIYSNYEVSYMKNEVGNNSIILATYFANDIKINDEEHLSLKSFAYKQLLEIEINKRIEKIKDRYNKLIVTYILVNLMIGLLSFSLYWYMRKVHNELKKETHLSGIDDLTHVFNRRKFNQIFVELWEKAKRYGQSMSLMFIDLDYFKEFNDNYGHSAGDSMLKSIGKILEKESSKHGGYVCRYGGDEFVILLPDLDIIQAEEAGNSILTAINDAKIEHQYSPIGKFQTASIGVTSMIPKDGMNINEFFNYADSALYLSKRYGRNRVSVWKS